MVIDAKLVRNGGMQVADVGGTFYGAIFRFVGVPRKPPQQTHSVQKSKIR